MSFLANLEWRYAAKKFDTTKKVSDADLEKILEAIRLTPTSFGMQPYHFYVITNEEKKQAIEAGFLEKIELRPSFQNFEWNAVK